MMGGADEQYLLRVVTEHADWWNYVWSNPEEYRHNQAVFKRRYVCAVQISIKNQGSRRRGLRGCL